MEKTLISAHPTTPKVPFKLPTSNKRPLTPTKKEKNNNKVHKRNTGIDYYGISLMAFSLNML